jgi:hypothetical protein
MSTNALGRHKAVLTVQRSLHLAQDNLVWGGKVVQCQEETFDFGLAQSQK